ncbi:transcription elongation factor GreA [Eubacteriales bacterium OttesenSCG-928-M02]|nr:transcription elongation factor GreA [Eubacteriales bacterium OttesenSCG-928-M02]
METTFLTKEGVKQLEEQLEHLKTVARKEIANQIRIAREFGDISENAEYDEAKNEQARIEGEIVQLEKKLRSVSVIDEENVDRSVVGLGTTVDLEDNEKNKYSFTIVGSTEANPASGRISNESPVGAALLGHNKGDKLEIATPAGVRTYKILKIS